MTYTKQQLEQMSDFEVNEVLANLAGIKWQISPTDNKCLMFGDDVLDYCENWNDIMPLAVENKICFVDSSAGFIAFAFCDDTEFESVSPQRALACCLVLVLQGRATTTQPA